VSQENSVNRRLIFGLNGHSLRTANEIEDDGNDENGSENAAAEIHGVA
jgi:hypothetical protein